MAGKCNSPIRATVSALKTIAMPILSKYSVKYNMDVLSIDVLPSVAQKKIPFSIHHQLLSGLCRSPTQDCNLFCSDLFTLLLQGCTSH